MDIERHLEIIRRLVKVLLRERDVTLKSSVLKREMQNLAKTLEVSTEELVDVVAPIMEELWDEMWERGSKKKS